ncbi:GAF and ANTAR domain-containing protein [Nocardioides KLBMP 9356]|uniref:GAF and ANTAR domain-containing protein n=1 Tax=Nocardioides potassii TaxID=2911371 RepID=A0ABS9H9I3_9ACTN|nr:GAF and ANTAR domain-containing protein [Nocardioides potassii]MCF6377872.1 GAF and ANTAR domain-containing protein [Nocardioides potassii]
MSSHDSLAVFAALAAELQQEPDEALTSRAIVNRMRDLVPEAHMVSLTIRTSRGRHRTLASSDPVSRQADALQYELGEGPCLEIADTGGWLRSGDVASDARYPTWGPRAAELGVASLLSVAVTDPDGPLGALNLYSEEAGGFADRDVVDLALVYAVHATTALSSARRTSTLQTAVSSRHVIGMAQGIAMERYDIDQHQSFELLRRLSSTTNVKLRDVAHQIVETRTIPHEGDGTATE